jgi:hypothetical protein
VAEQWTPEELAARRRERDEDSGDGAAGSSPPEAAVDREADGAASAEAEDR